MPKEIEGINPDFNIPFYLFESILEYVDSGKPASSWNSLYLLIKVAEENKRFSNKQTERLVEILSPKASR